MIRVLVADDFSAMRRAMERLIDAAGDMAVVGEAPTFEEVLPLLASTACDVIIMNDYLPPMSSAHATNLIRKEGIEIPVVVVSMHEDVELARTALANGANGFVLKTRFLEDFIPAIRAVVSQKAAFLSPPIAARLAEAPEAGQFVIDEDQIGDEGGMRPQT